MLMTKKAWAVLNANRVTGKLMQKLNEKDMNAMGLLPVRMTEGADTALFLMCLDETLSEAELIKCDMCRVSPSLKLCT